MVSCSTHSYVHSLTLNMTATVSPEFTAAREAFAAWYDSKDADTQELIDSISARTYFIIDEDEYDAFISLLADLGIKDAGQFEDAFAGEYEFTGEHITSKFAEDFSDDLYPSDDLPEIYRYAIDYQLVWYSTLRYDFYDMEFKGNTYFFNRNV
jgi:hypothetical protein